MRHLCESDIRAVARALLLVPADERTGLARKLVDEAHCADKYVQRFGKAHPLWGNGCLESRARMLVPNGELPPSRMFTNPEWARAFAEAADAIACRSAEWQVEREWTIDGKETT